MAIKHLLVFLKFVPLSSLRKTDYLKKLLASKGEIYLKDLFQCGFMTYRLKKPIKKRYFCMCYSRETDFSLFLSSNSKLQCSVQFLFSLLQDVEQRQGIFPHLCPLSLVSRKQVKFCGLLCKAAIIVQTHISTLKKKKEKKCFLCHEVCIQKIGISKYFFQPYNSETLKRLKKKRNRQSEYTHCLLNSTEQRIFSGLAISQTSFTLFSHALKQLSTCHKHRVAGK